MFSILTHYSHSGKYGHMQVNMVLATKAFRGVTFIDGSKL